MKKILSLYFLISSISMFCQKNNEKLEKIRTLHIAYITERLELTPEEAQNFWPIYNQFEQKQSELRKQRKQIMLQLKNENNQTKATKELETLIDKDETIEIEIHNNRRQLIKNLQGIIPNHKIFLLKKIEFEFKQTLLKQIKNNNKSPIINQQIR